MISKQLMNYIAGTLVLVLITILPKTTNAGASLGPRAGYDFDSNNLLLGVEAELGKAFQNFQLAPSLDFELGDNSFTTINTDFRLYFFHLPETGLRFYGSFGPVILLNSSNGGNRSTEIGLSLVAGLKIPMKGQKRYHVETRFGFGDIPEFKLTLAILFKI